jgi:hypothetical protein
MRVLGLAFAVLFAVTVPIATHANGPRSNIGGNYGTIPRGLWMITEAEKGYFGLKTAEFQSLPLGNFFVELRPEAPKVLRTSRL